MKRYSRRHFLVYGSAATGGLLVLGACSSSGDGGGGEGGRAGSAELPDIEGPELVTDPADFPSRFRERPQFAEMVANGELPPVDERIGQDPLVLRPIDGIGEYGGTLRRGFIGPDDAMNANLFCAGPDSLLWWDVNGENVVPNLARDFEMSDDFTELVVRLRRGMCWSDGEPFTADDIVFWYEHIALNPPLSAAGLPPGMRVNGQPVVVERIDESTVRYRAPAPHPLLPELLAGGDWALAGPSIHGPRGGGGYAPHHYLEQFLPAFSSEDQANQQARQAGFNGWPAHFANRFTWYFNPDLPTLTPWQVTQAMNTPPWEFFANPYSIWVDTEGNQLPYIDEITMARTETRDVLVLQTISGEYDFQDRHLEVAQLPQLVDNEERGEYTVHRAPQERLDGGIRFNLAYVEDQVIGDLFRDVDFRRALSLGIDRDQINEAFFLGTSVPTATMASDNSVYFPGEEWRTRWATFDREQANELLDGIGLTDRDGSGYRQRPGGGGRIRLNYQATNNFADYVGMGEMVGEQWAEIGIELDVQEANVTILQDRVVANNLQLLGLGAGTEDPFMSPDGFLPTSLTGTGAMMGRPYAQWFASGGSQGQEPPESLRSLTEAMELYRQGLQAPEDERIELGKQLFEMHADNVWSIGLVGFGLAIYGIYAAKDNLANVPARVRHSQIGKTPANVYPMTFYYT